jgi:hypothetical protein
MYKTWFLPLNNSQHGGGNKHIFLNKRRIVHGKCKKVKKLYQLYDGIRTQNSG